MAPETMLEGRISKAADVYAFGIILWEMFTGGYAFLGVPGALLGHQVSVEGKRPIFPEDAPQGFKKLAEWCWSPDPSNRPSFVEVLAALQQLRKDLPGPPPTIKLPTLQTMGKPSAKPTVAMTRDPQGTEDLGDMLGLITKTLKTDDYY
jgi:serine/threonine protein kinase